MAAELLAPLVTYHIANSLGWSALRPVQERAIPPILAGANTVVLARTAGGKTEAAFFPLLSRLENEGWIGLSILYLSPIRALLNNQADRLGTYFQWLGRRAEVWHGDTPESRRKQVRRHPPDCLLTTPESLEALLISTRIDVATFFGDLRVVVIDEVHAFAGDDRGWHLLAVLERLADLAGRDLQRIGLSATVGNFKDLAGWMAGHSTRPQVVVEPEGAPPLPEVQLDYVGSLDNAALVVSRLHAGEKRLVFCESRLRAELMAAALRKRGVTTWITHSSLPAEERVRAEEAFRDTRDCVIVATSTLELGIDVGDLDRVIQLDAPGSVASFLQRMGRTGRRAGTHSNTLIVCTDGDHLLRAAGLLHLWQQGYVEPALAPPLPLHVLAQQLLALTLQCRGITLSRLEHHTTRLAALLNVPGEMALSVLAGLVAEGWLFNDGGRVGVGPRAEGELGRRNFMELVSVFTSPPLFQVLHGRAEVGHVHALSFLPRPGGEVLLVLSGRGWEVTYVDWRRKVAYVQPADQPGRSRWIGKGVGRSRVLSAAAGEVLRGEGQVSRWCSARANQHLLQLKGEFAWLSSNQIHVYDRGDGHLEIWTFAGTGGNEWLATTLRVDLKGTLRAEDLLIDVHLANDETSEQVMRLLENLPEQPPPLPPDTTRHLEEAKFATCLDPHLRTLLLAERFGDIKAYQGLRGRGVRVVTEVG